MSSETTSTESFMRWTIGTAKITRVLELPPLNADPAIFIKTDKAAILERKDWLCPDFAYEEGNIILHFQAFIIDVRGKKILVDPCIGSDKKRSIDFFANLDGPFLQRLEEAG